MFDNASLICVRADCLGSFEPNTAPLATVGLDSAVFIAF